VSFYGRQTTLNVIGITPGGIETKFLATKARRGVAHHTHLSWQGLLSRVDSPTEERDMSPTNPDPLGMWRQFKHRFLAWQDGSSFDLPNLSDDILRDIGLSRGTERFKPAMPFWVP
jgi:uncharacterized protein YjiS (DUF1127 family)